MTPPGRNKSLIFPREHGAWGILLVPLVTGMAAGLFARGSASSLAPLTLLVLALFWLRTPLESWVGAGAMKARTAEEFDLVRKTVWQLAAVAAAASVWLFWGGRNFALLAIGAAAGVAFLAQALVKRGGRERRELAQIIGAGGLTATAPAAYCVATGGFGNTAWLLWIANLLFAANQIQFVQMRIRGARAASLSDKLGLGSGFLLAQFVLLVVLGSACAAGAFPWLAALAFGPILVRGFAWFVSDAPLAVHALGKRELLYACIFGVTLIAGLAL